MRKLPTKRQREFLDWELGVFFHFGIRTYNDMRDCDKLHQEPVTFNPTELDCEQWIKIIKEAGAKYAVFTAKHHDGFALWPTKYSDYSVKKSPWKNGTGDVVQEFVDACRKFGINVGIYYNPSQWGMEKMDNDEYNQYVIDQTSELLSNYGKIDYIWFDGAGSEEHKYDVPRLVKTIRTLQPEIMIFNMWDPDTRWIGNEAGLAPMYNSNIVKSLNKSVYTDDEENLEEEIFLAGECDCLLSGDGWNWFYNETSNRLKSIDELMGMYMYSVGRGSNMLINIGPDKRGIVSFEHKERILEFGNAVKNLTKNPVADNSCVSYSGNEYKVTLPRSALVNMVIIEEEYFDDYIERFEIGLVPEFSTKAQTAFIGETIGHKRICTFPAMYCDKVVIKTDKEASAKRIKNILVTYKNNEW